MGKIYLSSLSAADRARMDGKILRILTRGAKTRSRIVTLTSHYPAAERQRSLARLEKKGLVTSRRFRVSRVGVERTEYELTEAGKARARELGLPFPGETAADESQAG